MSVREALNHRIAREIMGLTPDEFFDDGTSVWWISDSGERRFLIAGFVDQPELESGYTEWQPHQNVAQALQAVDALVEKHPAIRYWLAYKPLGRPDPDYWFTLWHPYCELYGHSLHGAGCTRAKAICLAIEKWLDAQKEKQYDQK